LASFAAEPTAPADVQALIGTYEIVSAENSGQKTPRERVAGVIVRVTEDAIVAEDKNRNQVYGATYKLDRSSKPPVITMTSTMEGSKGLAVKGVLQQEGDTLKLLYILPPRVEGQEKEGDAGKRQILVVMKKKTE
jgi:uncharacterized protein (TIGR03067 family)